MSPDIREVVGQVFGVPDSDEQYGVIRECPDPSTLAIPDRTKWSAWAEDECGNAFVVSSTGTIGFWDHETDDIRVLATDWKAFVRGCAPPTDVELDPDQVESVWIDPEFARKHGLNVDEDGKPRGS